MTDKHTPTPWNHQIAHNQTITIVAMDRPLTICRVGGNAEDYRNAEFIVRACNSHYDLVAAFKTLTTQAQRAADLNDADNVEGNSIKAHKIMMALAGYLPGYIKEIDDAHAALTKAKAGA